MESLLREKYREKQAKRAKQHRYRDEREAKRRETTDESERTEG